MRASTPINISPLAAYNHPALFYVLATALPWAFWVATGYISHGDLPARNIWASVLGILGLASPLAIVAVIVMPNPVLRRDILARLLRIQGVHLKYWAAAFFLMLASILVAQAISLLFGYSDSQFSLAKHFSFSSGVFPVWFLLLVAPVMEELAWHSYGTDCLRRRFSLFSASMIFAAFWGIWHMPLALIKGYYQGNVVLTGWFYSANFLISIFPFVLLMNWLYYRSRRSILVAAIFHVTAGYFNEAFATEPMSKVIQTAVLCVVATLLIRRDRAFFLERGLVGADGGSSQRLFGQNAKL